MAKKAKMKSGQSSYRLLQDLMDSIPDVIYFKDRKGRLILVNKAHARGLGLEPAQVVGKTDFDIFPKERARLMKKDDEYVMARGKPIIDKIERSTRADGVDNYVSTTKIPRYDAEGKIVGLIGITRDITSRMQIDNLRDERDSIKRKLKSAEELNKMKSEFISVVSHELRTPLAITKEAIKIILDGIKGEINPGQRDLLIKAIDNTERLKRLIEELLDISRIEKGTLKLHYSLVNLNELVRDSAEFFKKAAADKGISLQYALPKEEVNIFIDPERVNQVISNLLDNAVKFTEPGGNINLGVNVLEQRVRIAVSDTGIGIARNELEKIFHKFEQADSGRNSRNKGIGLGLAIVKELVEKHGGEIWAESKLGIGSKFYFTLPRACPLNVLNKEIRDRINSALSKESPVCLINLLIVNYRDFDKLTRASDRNLIEALNKIITGALEAFRDATKLEVFSTGFERGEDNIVIPAAKEKDMEGLAELLKKDINDYLIRNKVENVFINVGIMDFPSGIRHPKAAEIGANIRIKRIQIGAEKRRFIRYAYQAAVELGLREGMTQKAQVLDISEGGLCFLSPNKLETDAEVKIKLNLPQKNRFLPLSGRVAWIRGIEGADIRKKRDKKYKIGLEFSGMKKETRQHIAKFIKAISVKS